MRNSGHIHARQHGVHDLRDLVDLVDRFVYGDVTYPLERDDFISWTHSTPNIEAIRRRTEAAEPLLFSKDTTDKQKFVKILLAARNQAAALIGLPPRNTVEGGTTVYPSPSPFRR